MAWSFINHSNKYDGKTSRVNKYSWTKGESEISLRIVLDHFMKNLIFHVKLV